MRTDIDNDKLLKIAAARIVKNEMEKLALSGLFGHVVNQAGGLFGMLKDLLFGKSQPNLMKQVSGAYKTYADFNKKFNEMNEVDSQGSAPTDTATANRPQRYETLYVRR